MNMNVYLALICFLTVFASCSKSQPCSAAPSSASSVPAAARASTLPEYAHVDTVIEKARKLFKEGHADTSAQQYERAIEILKEVDMTLMKKAKENVPGYTLDVWHGCMYKEADVYKELADVYYKLKQFDDVKTAYEKRVNLRMTAGAEIKDNADDYEYIVALCQSSGARSRAIIYNVLLLKARRSAAGNENNPAVMAEMDKFAKYLRKENENEKAGMIEARLKAIKAGSKPLPELWFSY